MPSLNALSPENVAHGVDITIQAAVQGGPFITIGEIYNMDYDEDQGIVKLPVLGSRRTGARQGRFTVTGSVKAYWINAGVRSMVMGLGGTTTTGGGSIIYHSQRPFQRYSIVVNTPTNVSSPSFTLVNVVFEKDVVKWTENAFAEETINFQAEDIIGQ